METRKKSLVSMQGAEDGSPCESERNSHNNGDSNWLPDRWTLEFKIGKSGNNKGKRYKCYVNSLGRKYYSKPQVFAYLEKIRTETPGCNWKQFLAQFEEWEMIIFKRRKESGKFLLYKEAMIKNYRFFEISEAPDDYNDYMYWPDWLPDSWTFTIRKNSRGRTTHYKDSQGPSFSCKSQVLAYLMKIGRKEAHENTDNANRSTLDLSMEPENEVIGSSSGGPPAKLATRSSKRKSLVMQGAGDGSPSGPLSSERSHPGDFNWLPDGWTVKLKTREGAKSKGKRYKCYIDSQGHECYSKPQVFAYLKKICRKEAPENTAIKRQRTTTVPVSSGDTTVKESVEVPWEIFVIAEQALIYRKKWEANPKDDRPKRDMENAEKLLHLLTNRFKEDLPAGWKYDPKTASTLVSRSPEDGGGELVSMSPMPKDVKIEEHKKTRNCCGKFPPEYKRWRMAREKAQWSKDKRELRVENLHSSMSEQDFKKIFEKFGPVKRVRLPRDPKTGHCCGFGYIEFARLKDSKAAAQSLNGKREIAGRTIKVCSLAAYDSAQSSLYWNAKRATQMGAKAAAMQPYE